MMNEKEFSQYRKDARHFFEGLERHLNQSIPTPTKLRKQVEEISRRARASSSKRERRNTFCESAFLGTHVFRPLHEFVAGWSGMDKETACQALLVEGYKHYANIASGTPRRWLEHPFKKRHDEAAASIVARWKSGRLVGDSCPDMALREPFPYKTVFECKFFRDGDVGAGASTLVGGVQEAFFYLGLAKLPERGSHAAWDYDFACFLAGDASDQGGLHRAWQKVSRTVKSCIWDSANIYVMVLRGSS
jgi:hypothetical protein